jgi:tetratricopeptide (TPR) repeat protein
LYHVRNDWQFPLFLNLSLPADRSSFLDHQTVFGQTPPIPGDPREDRDWFHQDPELQVPGIGDIIQMPEPDKAIDRFATALKTDAGSPVLRLGLAAALDARGDSVAALDAYRQALAANPNFYVTYHYIDAFFIRQNEPDGRTAQWRAATQAYPDNWLPCFHLAQALEETQDREGALVAYRHAVALNPDDAQIWNDIARLLLAQDDPGGAEKALQRVLQIDPHNPYALMDLGGLKMDNADYAIAEAMYRAAIDLDPDLPLAHTLLIQVLCLRRDYAAAWEDVATCRKRGVSPSESTLERLNQLSGRSN